MKSYCYIYCGPFGWPKINKITFCFSKFDLTPIFSDEDVLHWFIPQVNDTRHLNKWSVSRRRGGGGSCGAKSRNQAMTKIRLKMWIIYQLKGVTVMKSNIKILIWQMLFLKSSVWDLGPIGFEDNLQSNYWFAVLRIRSDPDLFLGTGSGQIFRIQIGSRSGSNHKKS